MKITDLRAVASIARAHKIMTLEDNTVATPVNQRPLELGIDLVFHSATKYFGGHSDISAGMIAGPAALLERIWKTHVLLGATLGPFDSWLMLRGLRTLPLRVRQHNSNALAVARFLERHPVVKVVHYPGLESHPQHELARRQMSGFGGLLSFELQDGASPTVFLSALRLSRQAPSLGGVETLGLQPAALFANYMNPEQAARSGIPASMLRFSIGLEDERDLIADFEQALLAAETGRSRVAVQV
jgi:methionine-gamma-lyase